MISSIALGALTLAPVALAQEDYPPQPPNGEIGGEQEGRGIQQGDGQPSGQAGGAVLPFTGGDAILFVTAGLILVVTGTMLYRRARARRPQAQARA